MRDITSSKLITHPPSRISDLIDCYNLTLSTLLNTHAPFKTKLSRPKPPNPWFNSSLRKLKSGRRHLEKIWNKTRSSIDLRLLRSATNHYHSAIIKAKRLYNHSLFLSNRVNPNNFWNIFNKLLHKNHTQLLPTPTPQTSLPVTFAQFFSDKIHKLHTLISSTPTTASFSFHFRLFPNNGLS